MSGAGVAERVLGQLAGVLKRSDELRGGEDGQTVAGERWVGSQDALVLGEEDVQPLPDASRRSARSGASRGHRRPAVHWRRCSARSAA